MKPAHRRGAHGARPAKAVVDAAYANPFTVCWRCGRTLDQHPPHKNGRPAFWTAGHVRDGDPNCPLLAEASVCNFSAGGRLAHPDSLRTTRKW